MTAPAAHFEITESTHGTDCPKCVEYANSAAIYASAMGTTGGTYRSEEPLTQNIPGFTAHGATVRRIPEGNVIVMHDPQTLALDEIKEQLSEANLLNVARGYVDLPTALSAILRRYDLIKKA